MECIVHDKDFEFSLRFFWDEVIVEEGDTPSWLDFQCVNTIAEWTPDGKVQFCCYDDGRGIASKAVSFDQAFVEDPVCNGFIKWDGCMEIHSFNMHFCGRSDIMQRLMDTIYNTAEEIIGKKFLSF